MCCSSGAAAKHQSVGRAFLTSRTGGGVRTESLIALGAPGRNHCHGPGERARRGQVRLAQSPESSHRVLCRHLTSESTAGPFSLMQVRAGVGNAESVQRAGK